MNLRYHYNNHKSFKDYHSSKTVVLNDIQYALPESFLKTHFKTHLNGFRANLGTMKTFCCL